MLKVSFLGSSDDSYVSKYKNEVSKIIHSVFEFSDTILVVNGGYQGLMKFISEEAVKISLDNKKQIFIQGNLFNGYKNDTSSESVGINTPNKINDSIITSNSIGDRAQSIISISDIIIALPGKSGTLHEILQTIEHIKYGMNYDYENDFKLLYLHHYWYSTFSSLFSKKVINEDVKKYLNFFNSKKNKDLDKFKELLKKNTSLVKKTYSPLIDNNTIDYKGTEINIECAIDSNHPRQDIYESFVYRINKIIKLDYENEFNKNLFLGFDIVIRKVEDKELISMKTFGTKSYAGLLQSFLQINNSILLNDKYIEKHKNIEYVNFINNTFKTHTSLSNDFMFIDHLTNINLSFSSAEKKDSEISSWVDHLSNSEYGKTLVWLNKEVLSGQYHISSFLLLDIFSTESLNVKLKSEIENFILNEIIEEIIILDIKKINQNATLAAISQIFARNFAHNIGSHVAIRATNKQIKKRLSELVITNLADENVVNWIDHMSEVLDLYEVKRNEYLAEFKLPPRNAMFYKDVVLPFCENTLLMDNIASSENICYQKNSSNRLIIRVFDVDGNEFNVDYDLLIKNNYVSVSYPNNFPYYIECINDTKKEKISLDIALNSKKIKAGNDIEFCLSNEHALYSILENFIRNSAKHNKPKLNDKSKCEKYNFENLEILIRLNEFDDKNLMDDFFSITIYDNISQISGDKLNEFLNKLKDKLLTESGEINKSNLGIADMKINAHLLNSSEEISDENLIHSLELLYSEELLDKCKPNFKKYESTNQEINLKKLYRFAYRFKLSKPKKIIWIGNSQNPDKEKLKSKGIILYDSIKEYKDSNNYSLASFDFAILELNILEKINESECEELLLNLPFRVLLNSLESEINGCKNDWITELIINRRLQLVIEKLDKSNISTNNFDFNLLKRSWASWLKKWEKEKNINLILYFEDKTIYDKWVEKKINDKIENSRFKVIYSTENKDKTNGSKMLFSCDEDEIKKLFSENNFNIIYDHHGTLSKVLKELNGNISFIFNNSYFQFDKSSTDFQSFYFPSDNVEENVLFLFKAMEAGLMNIAIVDERICEKADYRDPHIETINRFGNVGFETEDNTKIYNSYFKDLLNYGRTFLITEFNGSDLAKGAKNISVKNVNSDCIIKNPEYWLKQITNFDALIIHRTYLDEAITNLTKNCSDDKSMKKVKTDFMKFLNLIFCNVIITSGGGIPHSLDLEFKFRAFSNISSNFAKYQSKISLINTIK